MAFPFCLVGIATIMVASLTREAPQATRSFFLILPLEILSAYGLLTFLAWLKKQKVFLVRLSLLIILVAFATYSLVYYFTAYYVRFPIFSAPAWRAADKELALYLQENSSRYQKIIIDQSSGLVYISLLFYQAYPPAEFQQTVVWTPDDSEGFSQPERFGQYEFKEINWSSDYDEEGTLLVTTPKNLPAEMATVKEINYPTRPAVYAVKQKILSQPVKEKAYVIIESQK